MGGARARRRQTGNVVCSFLIIFVVIFIDFCVFTAFFQLNFNSLRSSPVDSPVVAQVHAWDSELRS